MVRNTNQSGDPILSVSLHITSNPPGLEEAGHTTDVRRPLLF